MYYSQRGNKMSRAGKKVWFILVSVSLILVMCYFVMFLWNALLPDLLHVNMISYSQAIGLWVLSRLLFGRFHFGRGEKSYAGGGRAEYRWKDKLSAMSEADRSAFKAEWRARCAEKGRAAGAEQS